MDTRGRLVAGSHNRNEFVLINADENARIKSVQELSGQICQICGDEVEITVDGELFVACSECAFPVCRPCYEMREERETKLALSVKPNTSDSKVVLDDIDNEFEYGADALGPYQLADGTNAYAIPM